MIGYVTIGALDVEQAMPFYDAVLGAIGYERQFFDGGWAGYGPRGGDADTLPDRERPDEKRRGITAAGSTTASGLRMRLWGRRIPYRLCRRALTVRRRPLMSRRCSNISIQYAVFPGGGPNTGRYWTRRCWRAGSDRELLKGDFLYAGAL